MAHRDSDTPAHRQKPYDRRQSAEDFDCKPVCYGYIQDVEDCLVVIAALRRGQLRGTRTRFKGDSESFFQSGQIFAYRRGENSVVRWTDGLDWTPSRVAGKQFVYRRWQNNDPGPFFDPIDHYYTNLPHDEVNLRRQMEYRKKVRNLTSSLVDGSKLNHRWITPGGLCKRTYTTKAADDHWHVYSYYTPQHALAGGLLRPTEDPQFASIHADFANNHESVRDLIQILRESELRPTTASGTSDSEDSVDASAVLHPSSAQQPSHSSSVPTRLSLHIPSQVPDSLRYVTAAPYGSYDASPVSPGGVQGGPASGFTGPSADFDRYRHPIPHGASAHYSLGNYHDYYCSPSATAVTEGFNRSPSLPTSERHNSNNPSPSSFSLTLPPTRLSLPSTSVHRPHPNHLTLPPTSSLAQYAIQSRAHRSDSVATSTTTTSSTTSLVSPFSEYGGSGFGDYTPSSAPPTKAAFSPFDLPSSLSVAPQRSYSSDNNYHSHGHLYPVSHPISDGVASTGPSSSMFLRTSGLSRAMITSSPPHPLTNTHDLNSPTNSDFEEMTKGMTVQRLNSAGVPDSPPPPPPSTSSTPSNTAATGPRTHVGASATPPGGSPPQALYFEVDRKPGIGQDSDMVTPHVHQYAVGFGESHPAMYETDPAY